MTDYNPDQYEDEDYESTYYYEPDKDIEDLNEDGHPCTGCIRDCNTDCPLDNY